MSLSLTFLLGRMDMGADVVFIPASEICVGAGYGV